MTGQSSEKATTGFVSYTVLNALRDSGRQCDLHIMVDGEVILYAHRAVLATRLPILDAEITKHAIPSNGILKLSWRRFPKSIVEQILDFVYMGEVGMSEETVERLYLVAFMLNCDELQLLCLDFMATRITNTKLRLYLEIASNLKNRDFYDFLQQCRLSGRIDPEILEHDDIVRYATCLDCMRTCNEKQKESGPKTTVFIYGFPEGDMKTSVLMTMPQFQEETSSPIEINFPRLKWRGVASLNGKVFFIGGETCLNSDVLPTVTVIDPETQSVSKAPPLNKPRKFPAVASSSTEIFVLGGWGGDGVGLLSCCERFAEGNTSWCPLPPLHQGRERAAAIFLGENEFSFPNGQHLLITGGVNGRTMPDVALLSLGVDDPTWVNLAPMLHARCRHGIALFAGRVLVGGGSGENSVEMLNPPHTHDDIGQWTELAPLNRYSSQVKLAVHQNRLLAFDDDQIEEFLDAEQHGNSGLQIDGERLKSFTWLNIGDSPNIVYEFDGALILETSRNPASVSPI